jgi:2-oxoisovalerate dehydrogenase E2 component (dihydrolipoyl transacylase)
MEQHTIKVPDVGEGVAEAELVELLVKVGDVVREDDVLVAVMTDKATVEIPSPYAGTVEWIGAEVGDKIAVGSDLVRLGGTSQVTLEKAATVPSKAAEASRAASSSKSGPDYNEEDAVSPRLFTSAGNAELKASVRARPLAAPSVRRRAREVGLDLNFVGGTGPGGRILHEDVDRSVSGQTARIRDHVKAVTEIKVVGLRRKIAEKMTLSKSRIPHITIVEEVDVTAIDELRASLNRQLADSGRLTILPFLMKAMAKALASQPQLNALFDDERGVIQRHASIDIGVATQTPSGLVVPVVRAVEDRSVFECAGEVERLAGRARDGSATREELTGSTITITSLGALGAIATTPVINYPEVAIVGVNRMAIRPSWNGSAFLPRKMMNLSSSFDHRVIDGWDAAIFVQRLKNLLENPAEIFIELTS